MHRSGGLSALGFRNFFGGHSVMRVDYEVLGLASDGRHYFLFCFGPTFFLVRSLGGNCGDDRCSLTRSGE
jgi:hypothetical protein